MNPEAQKIIVVEDDEDLRESVIRSLMADGFAARGVGTASGFYQCLGQEAFDLAIIDIGLPDQSGYVLADYLRNNTDLSIIILTARNEVAERVQGYASGADLYLIKPVEMEELVAAIASLAKRRETRHILNIPKSTPIWTLCLSSWCLLPPEGGDISLTAKEVELLRLLAEANDRPVPRQQLLACLHYPADDYFNRGLDNVISRLRKKIRTQTGRDETIHTSHSLGYSFAGKLLVR